MAGCSLRSQNLSVRLVAGCWCISALLLINYYNSLFISFLTVPHHEPIINSLEELAHSKLSLAVDKGSVVSKTILVKLIILSTFLCI